MSRTLLYGVLAGCLLGACDDGALRAFQPSLSLGGTGGSAPDGQSGMPTGAGADSKPPTVPLVVDDFEDGDTIANQPLGWWYPVNDGTGTQGFGIEPVNSGTASVYALRTHGSGFREWGAAVGVDLTGESASLSLVSYKQLCFMARVEAGSSTLIQVHFLQGGQHYIQELSLSENWARYCRPLVDFTGPAGEMLVPNELLALQFFFAPGSPFMFWLDDVQVTPF